MDLASKALESIQNGQDRETVARATLELLSPDLDENTREAVEKALKAGRAEAVFEIVRLSQPDSPEKAFEIDVEGVQVGGAWVPVQPS